MPDNASLFPGKHFISTVLEALDTKSTMSSSLARRYLMRAAMAGVIIGVMYTVNFAVIAAFQEVDDSLYQVGKIVGALFFGWALVFIYYSKSELLTSNMMIVSIGLYHRRTNVVKGLRILGPDTAGAGAWVRKPNTAPLGGGRSARERMLAGNGADLYVVRQ